MSCAGKGPGSRWSLGTGSLGSCGARELKCPLLQHQDSRDPPEEPITHAIDTLQVNGQEKYLIVSGGSP